ncbi:MAG: sodium:solute symporter family protein [Planctomycetaceae bacterium]
MSALLAAESHWLGLHLADWVVLGAYLLGITLLGIWSARKVHDAADFFMGGRRFGKVFMMFFAFGAGTSSDQAVGTAAGAFRVGLAGIWYQFLWLWATPFYWILAPVFRRMRALTTSDFFEARYDRSTALLYSLLGICISIVFIAAALFFGAKMVTGLTGGAFDTNWAIALMTVLFVIYGMAGGLGAAVVTDFVQGILTVIFSFLLLPFALSLAANMVGADNGFAAIGHGIPGRDGESLLSLTLTADLAKSLGKEPITWFYVIMLSLNGLVSIVVQPHIMGVCGAGKTEYEGRFGFTMGNFLKRFCTIAWTFVGLACVIVYLTPGNDYLSPDEIARLNSDPKAMVAFADEVYGRAAHDILPTIMPGLVGLLFAALLAAIMSTCDAQMVVASGLFTENIYKRYINTAASERHYVWTGRIAGLVIVGLALALMTQFTDAIGVLNTYVNAIPALIGLCFWFGIVWRGFTPKAVWGSTLSTLAMWYLTTKHTPIETLKLHESPFWQENLDYLPHLFRDWLIGVAPFMEHAEKVSTPWQYVLYLSTGAIVGIGVSLVTRRTSAEKLDHFFRLIRTPVRPGETVHSPCTLPDDPLPMETGKLIPLKDFEIPIPSKLGLFGFLAAWVMVGGIILLTRWLASLGLAP